MKVKLFGLKIFDIETESRLVFCMSCAKRLGNTNFFKGDSETEMACLNMIPICYNCFKEKIGKFAEIKL